jgi:hypothetical protein
MRVGSYHPSSPCAGRFGSPSRRPCLIVRKRQSFPRPLTSRSPIVSEVFEARMPHVLITHEIEAYQAWKAIVDQAIDIRKRAGEIRYQLLRYDNDANTIVRFSAWPSMDNVHGFSSLQNW